MRSHGSPRELVVCSLEGWDEVWRRNQFFTDVLMRSNRALRVLFVEPAADIAFDLSRRRLPMLPRWRALSPDGRLRAFRPLKPLPRRFGSFTDSALVRQVLLATRALRFPRPVLWINDVTYAPLIARTGWPAVYDVTDDWLLGSAAPRELDRLRRLDETALETADEVVVCSRALACSRGARRTVSLIPNAVDASHFRRPRPRPDDLPQAPTAVYVGSVHETRVDVELVGELATALPQLRIVLVGPVSLSERSRRLLGARPNVLFLGPRPYRDVPGYLQHADVVIVPHRTTPFTESLDPIKAYECLAVAAPTVATPVAGFRELDDVLEIAPRNLFVERVAEVLRGGPQPRRELPAPPTWEERGQAFQAVLERAGARSRTGSWRC